MQLFHPIFDRPCQQTLSFLCETDKNITAGPRPLNKFVALGSIHEFDSTGRRRKTARCPETGNASEAGADVADSVSRRQGATRVYRLQCGPGNGQA
jgi:hypothetical protein